MVVWGMQEQRGFMMVTMPVPYPFIPEVARLEAGGGVSVAGRQNGATASAIP